MKLNPILPNVSPWTVPARITRPAAGMLALMMMISCSADAAPQWSSRDLAKSFSLIDVDEVQSGGPSKDGIPVLVDPAFSEAAKAGYLNPDDRVIGVEINGEARAYPLRILIWHENANDTLGGRPIAVTYCPLCNSAFVFDRNIGGQVREFGISGRLYRSNVLMYDRQADTKDESLWSQLQMRAVVGPAAEEGLEMKLLPSEMTTWADWRARHPQTTVLTESTGHRRDYSRNPYASYFKNDRIGYGTHGPSKRRPDVKNKDMVAIVEAGGERRAYVVKDVAKAAGSEGSILDELGGIPIRLVYVEAANSIRVEYAGKAGASDPPEIRTAYSFWFAWEDLSPGTDLWALEDSTPE